MGQLKKITVVITIGCAALLAAAILVVRFAHPPMVLRACFHETMDLKKEAIVRVAGVDSGLVRAIRRHIGDSACPAQVEFGLDLPKGFQLPRNSRVSLQTDGVLGPTYLGIDIASVPGPPVRENEILATEEYTGQLTPEAAAKLKKIIGGVIDEITAKPIDETHKSEP